MTLPIDAHSDAAARADGSRVHPLIHAGRWIAADLFSTLLFVALYAATHSVYLATGLGVAAGLLQIVWLKLRRSPIDAMQWMSLALVVVFGGASFVTHDPRFIMVKPTLIYAAIGAVMLKRGWMARYMPPVGLVWARDVVVAFGYVWALLMFATGALNIAFVVNGDTQIWAVWLAVFPIASKLVLVGAQYLVMRMIVISRMRAGGALEAA